MTEHSHSFDWDNIQILDTEPNYYKRSISEMLHIKEQANGINAQTDTELLDESYFDVLDSFQVISLIYNIHTIYFLTSAYNIELFCIHNYNDSYLTNTYNLLSRYMFICFKLS